MRDPETYRALRRGRARVEACTARVADRAAARGKQVVGYGAPGKGNTLLNYCGIRTDFLDYTVDRNPYKQGKHTPGTHIPIHPPEQIAETKPDVIVILPWNLAREISEQLAYTAEWGARLVVPIPTATASPRVGSRGWDRRDEGRHLLRRARRPHGGGDAAHPEADDPDRQPPDPLGDHAVLRGLGAQRVRALPRLQGRRHPRVLPELQRGALQRLRARGPRRAMRASSCSSATSATGGSPSWTPGCSRRSASGSRRSSRI